MRKYIVIILVLISLCSYAQTPPRTGYLVQPAKWKFVNPIWLDSGAYITKISKTSGQNRYLVYDSVKGTIGYRYATTIDTTSLSNRINLKLNISDTAAMLSPYLKSAVTSVGLSMPNAFSVANSPITSTGTIAVTGAGTAAQYIRGDGQLATLPSGASGGSSVNYYLNGSVNQGTIGGSVYYEMNKTPVIGAGTDFALAGNGLISQFITDVADPNRLQIPAGNWNFEIYMSASSSGGTPKFYVELLTYDGTNFTSIASSSANPEAITDGTTIDLYLTALAIPQTTLLATDRLAIRVYIVNSTGGRTITMHTENSHLCEIITNFAGGVSALNGLTENTQYLAVGTSGNDFAINSLTDTHTFNLPTASSTKRGALSSTDWSTFNGKMNYSDTVSLSNRINLRVKYTDTSSMLSKYLRAADTLKLSNRINLKQNTLSLTTTGSSGAATLVGATLNIPQYSGGVTSVTGTAPVVSSGGTTPAISMAAATTFVDGYLTSTDWTTFNNKGSGTVQSIATGLGLSGGTITTNGTLLVDTASASIISRERAAMKFYPINSNPNSYLTTAVTSVAALTLGTSGTDLSSTVANGTTTPVITLNVPTASAANRGALSSTDWSTFDGKESVLTFSRGLSRATNTVRLDTSKSYLFTAGMKLSGLSNTFGQSRVAVIDSVTGAVGYKYISSGSVTGSSGISVSGSDVLLGQAAAGSGASNFAANRFVYLSTFALQIGGSSGNDLFKFDNVGLNTISSTSLGTTQVDTKGLLLQNTTAAAVNAQQISPSIHWKANGWKTASTAASQSVDMRAYLLPVQGTSNPTSQWKLQTSVNGGAYTDCFRVNTGSSGQVDVKTLYLGGNSLGAGYDGTADFYSSANINAGIITANAGTFSLRGMSSNPGTARLVLWNYQGRYYMNCMDDGTNATIAINKGTTQATASSVVDIASTTAGLLIPRMTTTQLVAIATPAEGLMVYDLTLHKLYVYDGTVWQAAW